MAPSYGVELSVLPAPKERTMKAQGNALGNRGTEDDSREGAYYVR